MTDGLHPGRGARKVVRLDWVPSGSRLHKWMHRLSMEMLDEMILIAAWGGAYDGFSVDSSRHRFNRYRLVGHPGDDRRANQRRRTDMTEAERPPGQEARGAIRKEVGERRLQAP